MTLKTLKEVNVTTENIQSKGKCVLHRRLYVVQRINYYSNRRKVSKSPKSSENPVTIPFSRVFGLFCVQKNGFERCI